MVWPKLSTDLPEPIHPAYCQSCGSGPDEKYLARWREHDDTDKPTAVIVVLCGPCGDHLIKPHPRLYSQVTTRQPIPGAMPLCADCRHRDGVRCVHPDAKANGGTGVMLTVRKPTAVHICRRGKGQRSGWMNLWPEWPTACQQKEPAPNPTTSPAGTP